jgi:hypothetical protein
MVKIKWGFTAADDLQCCHADHIEISPLTFSPF